MVVGDLDLAGLAGIPLEAKAVLVVDADAVLAGAISLQGFDGGS
jgi:DUF1009 family protein